MQKNEYREQDRKLLQYERKESRLREQYPK